MGGRGVECARGKVVGGSSSINAMAYVRGHRGDYDRWAAAGLPEWSYRACAALFPPAGILGRRRELFSRRRRPAHGADHALYRSAGRRLRCGRRVRRPSGDRGLQRRPPGGLRTLADDGAPRAALQRGGRLSQARAGAAQSQRRGPCARDPHRDGRRARDRCRICAPRAQDDGARRARGDPLRRRDQLAAAADAVRHRRPGRARAPRHRGPGGARRRRQESAGSHLGRPRLGAPGHRGVPRPDADRPYPARARQGLLGPRRDGGRPAGRHHGVPQEPQRRGAARHPAPVQCRPDDGASLSGAVPQAL